MALANRSLYHSAPSGPVTITLKPPGDSVDTGYSLSAPDVVIRAILCASMNQSAPSGPAVMPSGDANANSGGNSVTVPAVVIRPTRLPSSSVNHSAPSGPAAIDDGKPPPLGIG